MLRKSFITIDLMKSIKRAMIALSVTYK